MRKRFLWTLALVVILSLFLGTGAALAQSPEAKQWLEKGVAQLEKQQLDQAIASFKKALKEEPKSAVIYNFLGMAYRFKYNRVRNQELKQQEIAAFQKAIEIDPNYWVALINLGATYYYMGDKAKAAPLFRKALKLNPDNPDKAQLQKMIQEGEQKP